MFTFAAINQKGGVGKTTTAAAIGAGLARSGARTLLIDLDLQGNLSAAYKANTAAPSIMDAMTGACKVSEAIQHRSGLDIIPAGATLAAADKLLPAARGEYSLRDTLREIGGKYDYCVIDTPPVLGTLTICALTAADSAIVPAHADRYSVDAFKALYKTIQAVRARSNPGLTIGGIVLTEYNGRAVYAREMAEMFVKMAEQAGTRVYSAKIRRCVSLEETQLRGGNIFEYAPKSNAAADYAALVAEIIERKGKA